MSVIGIDFGSHHASFAVWHEEKNLLEVVADDLGFRSIPCVVGFRGEEIIVGHSAQSQHHKNANNTFDDVRSLLLNPEHTTVNVPVLEKEITVEELNSQFFRNIHNQVKQQAGKVIREAVVSVPSALDEATARRYIAAAQAGGIRIKSFIEDTSAALLAYGLDEPEVPSSRTLVVDLGWSRCTMALFNVSGGVFSRLATETSYDVSGAKFCQSMVDFCSKDFTRKTKIPVVENKRSMMRLKRECETAMKSLSTGAEATIDLDSLCEGADYSAKVSRARFEDLLSIPIIHFKNLLTAVLTKAGVDAASVTQVCLSGGPASLPKVLSTLRQQLPNAVFPKVRFETSEAPSIGAAIQAKLLYQLSLLDNAPTASPENVIGLGRSILIGGSADVAEAKTTLFVKGCPLPAVAEIPLSFPEDQTEGSIHFFLGPENEGTDAAVSATLGGLAVVKDATITESLVLSVRVEEGKGLSAQVVTATSKTVIQTLEVAFA